MRTIRDLTVSAPMGAGVAPGLQPPSSGPCCASRTPGPPLSSPASGSIASYNA